MDLREGVKYPVVGGRRSRLGRSAQRDGREDGVFECHAFWTEELGKGETIMATYDASIIATFADALYKEAAAIVIRYTIGGIVLGAAGGYFGGGRDGTTAGIVAAAIAGAIGWSIGRSKAFSLKLQAQTALCQMKIETNTSSCAFALAAAQRSEQSKNITTT